MSSSASSALAACSHSNCQSWKHEARVRPFQTWTALAAAFCFECRPSVYVSQACRQRIFARVKCCWQRGAQQERPHRNSPASRESPRPTSSIGRAPYKLKPIIMATHDGVLAWKKWCRVRISAEVAICVYRSACRAAACRHLQNAAVWLDPAHSRRADCSRPAARSATRHQACRLRRCRRLRLCESAAPCCSRWCTTSASGSSCCCCCCCCCFNC